ncbi:phospholipase A2 inhibitor and Ly6/PLAUR domain-containing protein-like [Pseudophryne corroboree]|uniref:phospholipase A2 inhibitor and Ly6/PLAUR domain-containing protein-like n=1 Tax=Pseudophryne corroboree TaxID=495146 RepID=UPI0030814E80
MMFLLTLCSALLTAGAALKCEVCSATNANSCSGSYETCQAPESRCMLTLTETSLGHDNVDMRNAILDKHCGSVYDCSHPATLSTPDYRVRVTTKCCNTDFCNNSTMNWTPPNSTLNGVTCESCFARNSKTCNVMTPMNCTGDETYCVQYSASREGGSSIAVAGCASGSMKKSQGKAAFQGSTIAVRGMQNGNGAESLRHYPLLLPSLAVTIIWMVSQ